MSETRTVRVFPPALPSQPTQSAIPGNHSRQAHAHLSRVALSPPAQRWPEAIERSPSWGARELSRVSQRLSWWRLPSASAALAEEFLPLSAYSRLTQRACYRRAHRPMQKKSASAWIRVTGRPSNSPALSCSIVQKADDPRGIESRIKTGRRNEDQRRLRWSTETLQRSSEETGVHVFPKEVQGVAALRRGETSRDELAIAIPIDGVVSLERTNVTCPIRPVINLGRSRVGSACSVRS